MFIRILYLTSLSLASVSSSGILYPRHTETREILSLDGLWNFVLTNTTNPLRGHLEKWYTKNLKALDDTDVTVMPVPASYNDIGTDPQYRDHVGPVWYQRKFIVPKSWEGQRVWVRFSSAPYAAEAWINGEWTVSHIIGHLPFLAEVTDVINYGSWNNITVVVDNTLSQSTIPQGSQETLISGRVKQTYQCDFFNYAGIDRPVVLYTTPTTYVDDITVNTTVNGTDGVVSYEIQVEGDDADSIRVSLKDRDENVVASSTSLVGILTVEDANLWWPYLMDPNPGYLYSLEVELLDSSGGLIDTYHLSVGIRVITWDNKSLKINDKPVYFRGFGRHEDSDIRGKGLDLPLIVRDHNLIKWIGGNSYRTSHYPYAEEIMDMADEVGIMIIDECPAVGLSPFTDAVLQTHLQSLTELLQRDKNRASVIMWSLANEPGTDQPESEDYFRQVVSHVKSLDTTRPVTIVNSAGPTTEHSGQFIDIASFNLYQAWYQNTGDLDVVIYYLLEIARQWNQIHDIPVMLTEYGADTMPGLHMLPAFVWSEEFQDELLAKYFEAFDQLRSEGFFIGELIWNFADFKTDQSVNRVGGNKKGVFTRDRQPKSSAHLLRRRYWALAQSLDQADVPGDVNGYVFEDKISRDEL